MLSAGLSNSSDGELCAKYSTKVLWICLPTYQDQAAPWKQTIPLNDHWCALSGWGESGVCVSWLQPSHAAVWESREGRGGSIIVPASHPVCVCLCLGSRWKKRHPTARGPPNLSPHRPDQSRGAPSWPLPGLPQQVPESLLGLAACYHGDTCLWCRPGDSNLQDPLIRWW